MALPLETSNEALNEKVQREGIILILGANFGHHSYFNDLCIVIGCMLVEVFNLVKDVHWWQILVKVDKVQGVL